MLDDNSGIQAEDATDEIDAGGTKRVGLRGTPRPELDGLRIKAPNSAPVYLVMFGGYRHHIPNEATYNRLFRSWNGIRDDPKTNEVSQLAPLTPGAVLARGEGTEPIFLVSNGRKFWVKSQAAMDRYDFDYKKVVEVPVAILHAIPNGANIEWSEKAGAQ